MSHTLRSGLTAGSVDHHEHGVFEIAGGSIEVDDYAVASDLVDEFGSLSWADADPKQPTIDGDDADAADDAVPETHDPDDDGDDGFDTDAWLDRDYEARSESVEAGEVDAHLDAIEDAERSKHVLDAVESRQDELEG